ncbi:kinase-like domain-containing protein [Rhizophagus clarus]|uniref:Kinase-like domain-containing protein n=1 Tax=Rhizophagus clarus TaxID=94130 RepID=A0A8H3LXH3_9GLOM|nr:kinase-like domain-containing protein [Rhizophagus clarus]
MNIFAKVGVCFFVIIFFVLSLAGLASFSLEVAKIALFNQTHGELKLHPMDYVYLTALVLGTGGYCCHSAKSEDNKNNYSFGISGTLISLEIMVLYAIFTKDEMGNIPFYCSASYPYSSQLIRTACQVRAANLLLIMFIIIAWKIINYASKIINIFGFTKNPNTSDYVLIMEYANKSNLRKCLSEITNIQDQKLFILYKIIGSLNNKLNKILEESQELKFFEKEGDIEREFFKLKKIVETSLNGLKEKQMELITLQQKKSQINQDNQNLKLELIGLLQDLKFNAKLKAKLKKENNQLKQKLKQIK